MMRMLTVLAIGVVLASGALARTHARGPPQAPTDTGRAAGSASRATATPPPPRNLPPRRSRFRPTRRLASSTCRQVSKSASGKAGMAQMNKLVETKQAELQAKNKEIQALSRRSRPTPRC